MAHPPASTPNHIDNPQTNNHDPHRPPREPRWPLRAALMWRRCISGGTAAVGARRSWGLRFRRGAMRWRWGTLRRRRRRRGGRLKGGRRRQGVRVKKEVEEVGAVQMGNMEEEAQEEVKDADAVAAGAGNGGGKPADSDRRGKNMFYSNLHPMSSLEVKHTSNNPKKSTHRPAKSTNIAPKTSKPSRKRPPRALPRTTSSSSPSLPRSSKTPSSRFQAGIDIDDPMPTPADLERALYDDITLERCVDISLSAVPYLFGDACGFQFSGVSGSLSLGPELGATSVARSSDTGTGVTARDGFAASTTEADDANGFSTNARGGPTHAQSTPELFSC
ncbi:hypothetical protein DFP72DRAFT_858200 [Ephemerocybe angulata]|uniref:Uncharacterized protein n=1 Tax=Ephemerocybe angulata TaxID=980116 RepID=A0A8H6LU53_9AGAR|nr:hypothetical protein DFP72DRAFT_858200 [Tulosesus angulatus]